MVSCMWIVPLTQDDSCVSRNLAYTVYSCHLLSDCMGTVDPEERQAELPWISVMICSSCRWRTNKISECALVASRKAH